VLISWGRCSLIGLLVVMSVVVVLVLLLYSFPVDGVGVGGVPVHLFLVVYIVYICRPKDNPVFLFETICRCSA